MNDLEKHLERIRPDLEVPIFQRKLRRDLLRTSIERAPSWGYLWSFCAGMAMAVAAMFLLAAFKPEASQALLVALNPAHGATNREQVVSPNDHMLAYEDKDEAAFYEALLNEERFREADRGFVRSLSQEVTATLPSDQPLQLQPIGKEEVLTVRQYRTNTGKVVRVYTSHSNDKDMIF